MPKTPPQLHLDLFAARRKRVPVASMDDLVEGRAKLGRKPRGWVKRFWESVKKGNPNECWQWTGYINTNPKAKTPGVNSRIYQDRDPGHPVARKSRQNESFSGAVNGLVDERNKRTVWTVGTHAYPEAHFATYPPDLIKPCILAGCPAGGTVLDPFGGSGTTGMVALELGRNAILIELNPDYVNLANDRCNVTYGLPLT